MDAEALLTEIADYCRAVGMAETTFGRHAVNDGKLVTRLRYGRRIRAATLGKVRHYIETHPPVPRGVLADGVAPPPILPAPPPENAQRNFRFFDNRQKYLLFVNTCSEKTVVAERVGLELANLHPNPPALRVFDAGVGDGTVLSKMLRAMHARFPTVPFYVTGKEISMEDVRLALQHLPDRLHEHPATVVVLTNMYYTEAPWLTVRSLSAANSLAWHEVPLTGDSSHAFTRQIDGLGDFLAENWRTGASPTTGNPMYERPAVLVLYREDQRFLLDRVIPRRDRVSADYDLVIASQPYRARSPVDFKARRVIAPLARALAPGGRLIGIHSYGRDPGAEIVRAMWPGDDPFQTSRHDLLKAVKQELGPAARDLNFNAYSDGRSIFRYDMHTLPSEVGDSIGTSTLFAAWNAAIYVGQVEDERLAEAVTHGRYIEATREVLRRHGGLWFNDESYVISRRRR
jgi:SAM-dependent methyltransferase